MKPLEPLDLVLEQPNALLVDPEMRAVRATYCGMLSRLPSALDAAGRQVLEGISTPGWTLEWYLPLWLAHAFDLSPSVAQRLVLANVYGLSSLRLQDDLEDGELGGMDRPTATRLAEIFFQEALQQYQPLFASTSPFWHTLDGFMSRWRAATRRANLPLPRRFARLTDDDFHALAERGAPLKICCVASCLLAGRAEQIPGLCAVVDDLLVGTILLDHACDWREDLAAGRHNLFVAYASPHPQTPDRKEVNRRAVLRAIYQGEGARPFFLVARSYAKRATELSGKIESPPLTHYCARFEAQIASAGEEWVKNAAEMFRAVESLLGSAFAAEPSPFFH